MQSFFYIERKKDLRTDYQNWGLNHKSTENSAISDKKKVIYITIAVLDQYWLLCEENRHAFVICFAISTIWHEEGAIIHPNSNIILWYNSGLESETFKSCYYQWMAARQTRQTSKRPIFCQEQFKDLKEDHFLKTVSYFPPNKLQVFLVFFFCFFKVSLDKKKSTSTVTVSLQNVTLNVICILLWLGYQIWKGCNESFFLCVIHIKISFHWWVKFAKV